MAVTDTQMAAEQDAFSKQYDAQQAAEEQKTQQAKLPPSAPQRWMSQVGRVSTQQIDAALADDPAEETQATRKTQDVAAGAVTGATNIVDAGMSLANSVAGDGAAGPINAAVVHKLSPIWDHAKSAILNFRDEIQVKDPTLSDHLVQGAAQLAIPFAGYGRMLAGLHGFANLAVAGAVTDATALGPHDSRFADLLALGQTTEGKLGDALRALGPHGLNSYINYLTDRTNETEAQGRWKNVLDGFGVNLIATPLLHAAGVALKQGQAGIRYAMQNGAMSTGDFFKMGPVAGSPAAQAGKVGYHGTPYDPQFFDNSKIGTGEGAQVYGHGHYIAGAEATGQHYANTLSANGTASAALKLARQSVVEAGGSQQRALVKLNGLADNATHPNDKAHFQKAAELVKSGNANVGKGNLLKVEIADEHIAKMLDWDKKLGEQPDVLAKIRAQGFSAGETQTGAQFMRAHMGTSTESAPYLSQALDQGGIPGVKYLDAKSRTPDGEGTHNYVVFDGKNIKIVGKNGKPVGK